MGRRGTAERMFRPSKDDGEAQLKITAALMLATAERIEQGHPIEDIKASLERVIQGGPITSEDASLFLLHLSSRKVA